MINLKKDVRRRTLPVTVKQYIPGDARRTAFSYGVVFEHQTVTQMVIHN
jgi:hypothetical protein